MGPLATPWGSVAAASVGLSASSGWFVGGQVSLISIYLQLSDSAQSTRNPYLFIGHLAPKATVNEGYEFPKHATPPLTWGFTLPDMEGSPSRRPRKPRAY